MLFGNRWKRYQEISHTSQWTILYWILKVIEKDIILRFLIFIICFFDVSSKGFSTHLVMSAVISEASQITKNKGQTETVKDFGTETKTDPEKS